MEQHRSINNGAARYALDGWDGYRVDRPKTRRILAPMLTLSVSGTDLFTSSQRHRSPSSSRFLERRRSALKEAERQQRSLEETS